MPKHRYHIAVSFDVPPEHHEAFIAAALEDGRESERNEPGTGRFELVRDQDNPNRFYLDETYVDQAAFDAHCNGPYFKKFFEVIGGFAKDPTWLIRGTRIEDTAARERSISKATGRASSADAYTVIAEFRARPGAIDQLRQELVAMIAPSLAESGCRAYRPYLDATDPNKMILVEQWDDRAALERHFQTPHFKKIAARLEELLAEPFKLREFSADEVCAAAA